MTLKVANLMKISSIFKLDIALDPTFLKAKIPTSLRFFIIEQVTSIFFVLIRSLLLKEDNKVCQKIGVSGRPSCDK